MKLFVIKFVLGAQVVVSEAKIKTVMAAGEGGAHSDGGKGERQVSRRGGCGCCEGYDLANHH